MERALRFLLLIFLLVPFRGTDVHAYVIRKDLRTFQVPRINAPMPAPAALHPDTSGTEYTFLPPVKNLPLLITLSSSRPSVVRFVLSSGTREVRFPVSPDALTVEVFLPDNSLLYSVEVDGHAGFQAGEGGILKPAARLSLEDADALDLTLSGIIDESRELKLEIRGSGKVEFSPENRYSGDTPFNITLFGEERRYQFSPGDYNSAVWRLSPLGNLDLLSLESVEAAEFPSALLRDGGQILENPPCNWRNHDFEIYSWTPLPDILIFDCLNYEIQNRLFRRLSYFVEKKGFSGTLLTNRQLADKHGWNAHDYRPSDLADFFNLVEKLQFPVYPEEDMLLLILLKHDVLERDTQGLLVPGKGAVLSISRESTELLRKRFLTHEASHGLYFVSGEYRDFVRTLWESLDDEDRQMWRFFLGWYGYDPEDEDLMINEFQSYLVQQSPMEAPSYFGPRMANLAVTYPGRQRILNRRTGPEADVFRVWAGQLGEWIDEKWGLEAGNFSTLRKELH